MVPNRPTHHICRTWDWTEQNNIWITAVHIPAKYNVGKDKESQKSGERDKEYMLNKSVLGKTIQHFHFYLEMDLFASRLNQ